MFGGRRELRPNGHMTAVPQYAHRLAWELTHGPIPGGQCVLHRCDVPHCVNPAHLFLGTQKHNMGDAAQKGRLHVSRPNGQRLTPDDVAELRRLRAGGALLLDLAHQFQTSKTNVSLIVRGLRRQYDRPSRRKAVA